MEGVQTPFVWGIAIVLLAVGFAAGVLAFWLFRPKDRRARQLETELDKTREDLENYRADVTRHFQRTSQVFEELTENYKTLYTHLAAGAGELCGDQNRPPQLDIPENRLLAERNEAPQPTQTAPTAPPAPDAAQAAGPTTERTDPSDQEEESHLGDTPRISDLGSARADKRNDADKPPDTDRG
ncbi:MAG: DUF1043 family protein [Gammaproteobacteria bacterium]